MKLFQFYDKENQNEPKLGYKDGNRYVDITASIEEAIFNGMNAMRNASPQDLQTGNLPEEAQRAIANAKAASALPKNMMEVIRMASSISEGSTEKGARGDVRVFPPMPMQEVLAGMAKDFEALPAVELNPAKIDFAPVVDAPEKIICIGLNYSEHKIEIDMNEETPFPPVFCKFRNALTGHGQKIELPKEAVKIDIESELVIVMGKTAKDVSEKEALSYAFGYTVGNDVSARDLQTATSQWTMGKALDGFAPVGPVLVTMDQYDPAHKEITSSVNGKQMQIGNTDQMIFSCAKLISHLSHYMTLQPGDLIFTGTPSGVIMGRKPEDQHWIKSGDSMTCEIEGIGKLSNKIK